MLRQELVRTVASRQMQLVGLPHNVSRVRRVAREVSPVMTILLQLGFEVLRHSHNHSHHCVSSSAVQRKNWDVILMEYS